MTRNFNMECADSIALRRHLSEWRPSVPPRGPGRTKLHTEPWILRQLLLAAGKLDVLTFPISIESGDRPDFDLLMPGSSVGIEVTEIVPPCLAQAIVIGSRYYPGADIDRALFRWGACFTAQEIHSYFKSGSFNGVDHWVGDAVEEEWAQAVTDTLRVKTEKLSRDGYRQFPEYWLAAYTSHPGPALDLTVGAKMLTPLSKLGTGRQFENVFLLLGDGALVLTASGEMCVVEPLTESPN